MQQMKNSGIEWVGDIPESWVKSKIKNVSSMIGSGTTPKSSIFEFYEDGTINWIQSGDIYGKKYINSVSTKITELGFISSSSLKIYKSPFIIIAMYGGSVGNTAISLIDGCTNQACCCIKPNEDINFKFLYYWFLFCRDDFLIKAEGGGQPNISQDKIKNQIILVPPIDEQRKIADFLDGKCEEIDGLSADIQAQIDTLEQYKCSVITEAVTRGLTPSASTKNSGLWYGEIPENWSAIKGKYLFIQRNERGNTINIQLLSPTQKYGVIPQDKYEELTGMNAVKLNDKINLELLKTIHRGDYCISLRSFQGGFEYSEYEGVVSPAYQVFYPTKNVDRRYYKYLFKEKGFIDIMNSFTMSLRDGKNIAYDDFGNTYIPYPPIEEQQQIADYLDKKCAEIDSIIADKKQQLETLDLYKKSLIYEYVTGKKEVI